MALNVEVVTGHVVEVMVVLQPDGFLDLEKVGHCLISLSVWRDGLQPPLRSTQMATAAGSGVRHRFDA